MMQTLILDASAIMNGFESQSVEGRQITTPEVLDEIHSKKENLTRAMDVNKIEARNARREFVQDVQAEQKQTRDTLSANDRNLIALALEFRGTIVTDDYGIQNIAKKMGLKFIAVGEHGIKEVLRWQFYCVGCRKTYTEKLNKCLHCGSEIKRRARR